MKFVTQDGQVVIAFTDAVLAHMAMYRQNRFWRREAGGQLFSRLDRDNVCLVERVTGPRRSDTRARRLYLPDRISEQAEIVTMFNEGFHFIGDWHTHPEPAPRPSTTDLHSINDCVRRSKHGFTGFFLVIVGTMPVPEGLHVSFHTGSTSACLHPEPPRTRRGS